MGILNLTPDSFYASSRVKDDKELIDRAGKMLEDGADILDLGAYSTRPGADHVSPEIEMERLVIGITTVRNAFPSALISADTFRAAIARAAVEAGASLVNDVGCGILDTEMFSTVAELNVPYILMHNRAMPKEMTQATEYRDLIPDVISELNSAVEKLKTLGHEQIIIDPGFGFSKTIDQNFQIMRGLSNFEQLGFPVLVGISRKSMIYKSLHTEPSEALVGTSALHMMALENGANILRVHDVKACKQVITLWEKTISRTVRNA